VSSAFQGLLRDQFHPGYFVYMQIDPKTIDINIHPTKTEVKFEEERNLYAIIKSMVKHSLGMFQAAPVLDFERDPSLDTPYNFQQKPPSNMPSIEVDSSFNPFKDSEKGIPKASKSSWESLYSGLEMPNDNNADEELKLAIEQAPKVFQLLRKFIVTTTRSGLLVIDQQRAHQRVLYEKFLTSITKRDMVSQQLIFPKEVELTPQQIALFGELEANLNAMGFVVKQKDNHLHITGIPAICDDKQLGQLFEDVFSPPDDHEQVASFSQADYMAKILSKSLSTKGNLTLSIQEQQALVDDLFACKDTLTSPFNRKIFITLDKEELEKKLD
jgi:DNA mismatch repair protein MutL